MLTTWKERKVKRYKKRAIVWVCSIGFVILLGIIVVITLLILKVI
jgi:hypothetical protein